MELRHLRYSVAVGEEEHFGRAAERLHVVQPALTCQVRQLEEELGCALFERLKWGVRLTETGKSFLEEARRLAAVEEIVWVVWMENPMPASEARRCVSSTTRRLAERSRDILA